MHLVGILFPHIKGGIFLRRLHATCGLQHYGYGTLLDGIIIVIIINIIIIIIIITCFNYIMAVGAWGSVVVKALRY